MAISLPPDRPSGPKNTVVSASGEKDSPAFPHPTYNKLKSRWEKCRAFMGETADIRDGGETFLIRFPNEGDESYEFRQKIVAVSNFFKRAVMASVGLLLENEPAFGKDMPQELVTFSEDITLSGKHISVYAREIATDHIVDGCAATLVDFPVVDNPQTVDSDAAARMGLRPFFVKYQRSDILKVVPKKINGVETKVLVVLRETGEELDGDFGIKNVVHYRVFRWTPQGVTWERWRGSDDKTNATERVVDPKPLIVGGTQAKKIPLSLLGDFDELPPLENLADLNIEHHNAKTNRRNLEFLAMVPTPVRIGAKPDVDANGKKTYPQLILGPRGTIEAPYPPAGAAGVSEPVYWLSPPVDVLEPSERSLEAIQSDIGTAAGNFLHPDKRAAETVESKRIGARAEKASLASVGRKLKDHLEECYGFAGATIKKPGGTVTIDVAFEDTTLTAEEMRAYLDAAIQGKLSTEEFLEAWKRGKRLDPSLNVDNEVRRISQQNALPPEEDGGQADGTPGE